jgi:hypothetical protein
MARQFCRMFHKGQSSWGQPGACAWFKTRKTINKFQKSAAKVVLSIDTIECPKLIESVL